MYKAEFFSTSILKQLLIKFVDWLIKVQVDKGGGVLSEEMVWGGRGKERV